MCAESRPRATSPNRARHHPVICVRRGRALSASAPPCAAVRATAAAHTRVHQVETTAAGAAIAAGLGAGVFTDVGQVAKLRAAEMGATFRPAVAAAERQARKESWAKAVECSLGWAGRA